MAKSVFDIPVTQMPRVKQGDAVRARDFNTHSEALERIYKGVVPAQQIFPTQGGVAIGGGLTLANVVAINENHLTCRIIGEEETIEVARTYLARSPATDTRQGIDFTYTNYNADFTERISTATLTPFVTETQIVFPEYVVLATVADGEPNPTVEPSKVWISGTAGESGVSDAPDWQEISTREWRRKP